MREVLKWVRNKRSRLYGYNVMWTYVPEEPMVLYYISRDHKVIYINKGAHKGAGVVNLI